MSVETFAPLGLNAQDLNGKKFGRLTVIGFAGRYNLPSGDRLLRWTCICECGNKKTVLAGHLVHKKINSCGCLQKELMSKRMATHGLTKHHLFHVWNAMIQRCTNPKDKNWSNYGGRGITVCDRWKDIALFIEDMDYSFREGLTIDRIDNSKGYDFENCRWITQKMQMLNTRRNHRITIGNTTKTITEWSQIAGITCSSILYRFKNWPIDKVLITSVKNKRGSLGQFKKRCFSTKIPAGHVEVKT